MIILDGKNIAEFGFEVEPGNDDPITPVFEHKTIAIPGRPGLWDFGAEIKEKPFAFPLKIHERFHDNMQQAYNELVAFLFDEFGQPREIKITREYESDKFIMAKVMQQMIPDRLTDEGNLTLPFIAHDPYKYSNVFADEVTWGSEDITFETAYLLGHENDFSDDYIHLTRPDTLSISVSGLAIQPIFIINGTGNNLTISSNGYSFKLPDFENVNWEIDFEKYLVSKNGQETMIEIREFYLMPGQNDIKVTGTNIDIQFAVKYHDKYN